MVTIDVDSGPKGGNPGGMVRIPYDGQQMKAYLKYCPRSELPHDHPMQPHHQPVYEAITNRLARYLGLSVPDHFVLNNMTGRVTFRYTDAFEQQDDPQSRKRLRENMPYYYVSKWIDFPEEDVDRCESLEDELAAEALYRDILALGDIEGVGQNIAYFYDALYDSCELFYIDLGCSFVDAKAGSMQQRNEVSKLIEWPQKKKNELKTAARHSQKRNARYLLETPDDSILSPDTLKEVATHLHIPVFPDYRVPVNKLLRDEEIDYISSFVAISTAHALKKHENSEAFQERLIRLDQ